MLHLNIAKEVEDFIGNINTVNTIRRQNVGDIVGIRPIDTKVLLCTQAQWPIERISAHLGIPESEINTIRKSERFKERLVFMSGATLTTEEAKEVEKDAVEITREYLEDKMMSAAKKIVKLSKSGTKEDRIQLDAAKEILHLAGLVPKKQIETTEKGREYTHVEIQNALVVLQEIEGTMNRLRGKDSQFYLSKPKEAITHTSDTYDREG